MLSKQADEVYFDLPGAESTLPKYTELAPLSYTAYVIKYDPSSLLDS